MTVVEGEQSREKLEAATTQVLLQAVCHWVSVPTIRQREVEGGTSALGRDKLPVSPLQAPSARSLNRPSSPLFPCHPVAMLVLSSTGGDLVNDGNNGRCCQDWQGTVQ